MQNYNTWYGPFALDAIAINSFVFKNLPGVYVLSYSGLSGMVNFKYVGRSDEDLNGRLQQWIKKYPFFHFLYCQTQDEAYWHECEHYHTLPGQGYKLDNNIHPDKPKNSSSKCHHCMQ